MEQLVWRNSRQFSGTRAALRWWRNAYQSDLPPRGFVWIVHGMGEHSGRYGELATFLTQFGFDVLAPDLPGHGLSRSEGGQKQLVSIEEMTTEVQSTIRFWLREGPVAKRGLLHTPWYLIGHSMGSIISLNMILKGKGLDEEAEFARRAFISAAPLKLRLPVPVWKTGLARGLEKLFPYLEISNGIKPEDLTNDAAVLAEYRKDKLIHHSASPQLYNSLQEKIAEILDSPSEIEIPVCLAVGQDDPIVDPSMLRDYFSRLGTHKKYLEFPGYKHEIFKELGRSQVFKEIAEWFL